MIVVQSAKERLNLDAVGDLLLAHALGDTEGVAIDACNDSVTVRAAVVTRIGVQDNSLPSSEAAAEDDNDLAGAKADEGSETQEKAHR